jgi:hypothetical protein
VSNHLTLDLWNSILPLVCLCALVVFLPGWFTGRNNLSHRKLAFAAFKTAVVAYGLGALIVAALYASINEGVYEQFLRNPVERTNFFLSRSALFAMLWGPLLGFVWLVNSQEMNRWIGLKMMDGEGGKG